MLLILHFVQSIRHTLAARNGFPLWSVSVATGQFSPPLGIFKGKNVLQNWILDKILNSWFFSANTKGWTSNLHGLEWLKRIFEPLTRTKANGKYRLLICDGHDSHISGSFIAHCLQNRILLMILLPYTSHLL